jgi:hypothetical protein
MNSKILLIAILIVILVYVIGTLFYLNSRGKWPVIFKLKNTGKDVANLSISVNGKFFKDISLSENSEREITVNDSIINWMNNLPLRFSDLLNISISTDFTEKIQFSSNQKLILYLNGEIVRDITGPGIFYIYF